MPSSLLLYGSDDSSLTTVDSLPPSADPVHPEDTIEGGIRDGSRRSSIAWWVKHSEVRAFEEAVYGEFKTIEFGSGLSMVRRVPMSDPREPNLVAERIRVNRDGWDPDEPDVLWDRYSLAKVTVDFSLPTYNEVGGPVPFAAFARRRRIEAITIPAWQAKYEDTGLPLQQDIAIFLPVYDVAVTLFNASIASPAGLAVAEQAPLNSEDFNTPWGAYGPGTVMFETMSEQGQQFTGGFSSYQATLEFKIRPTLRWDYRARESGIGFGRVVRPDGSAIVPMSNLNNIFAY